MPATPELIFPQAVLNFPPTDGALITYATNVYNALYNNPLFPDCDPPLPVFLADIKAYADAQGKAANKGWGMIKARNARRRKVKTDLHHLRDYIQSVAETAASPADAAALITSVFLSIKKVTLRSKAELAASNTGVSGEVELSAKAVADTATYYWEYSLDQKSWTAVPETMQSKTRISGLTPATTYYFRFRALTRKGKGDYSQVVSLLVH